MNEPIKILITGDTFLGGGRVSDMALSGLSEELFGDFLKKTQNADLTITNLESPLVESANPISKTGPNLKSPIGTLNILKQAGFDLLTLANNHIMDFGEQGLRSTLEACRREDIKTVGAGTQKDGVIKPFICKLRGVQIGIINIAENEFGTAKNGSPGAHALNPVQNYYRVKEICHSVNALIVIVHGGHEGYPLPSPRMQETYRFFIDAGATAVIGHHPHCYSGYEIYKGAPIFYSLGNFLFDKENEAPDHWNEGYMVELVVNEDNMNFNITPYIQNAEKVGLRTLKKEQNALFEETLSQLNEILTDEEKVKKEFVEFCESSRNLYISYLEPHANKYLHALQNRKLFPSLLNQKKRRLLLNLIRCEAHRDVLKKILST